MSDGDAVTAEQLEHALQRQREDLLRDVATLQGAQRPLTQADASRTMAQGYAAEAERREREAEGGEEE